MDKQSRRANKESLTGPREIIKNPPWSSETIKSLRHEPPEAQDNAKRRDPSQAMPPKINVNSPQAMPPKTNVNPTYNPFIHTSAQPQRQDVITFRSTNPSDLNREQRESAEKAEVRRRAPRKNAPVPEDSDETNTDGETSYLYQDKLTPAEKSRILRLTTEIRRIKQKSYTPAYLRDKERAINHAEFERLAGQIGPDYLAGVPYPWYSDRGQAPIHYDVYQVDILQSAIDKIKDNNAVMCQLEYTANRSGPGGQARC